MELQSSLKMNIYTIVVNYLIEAEGRRTLKTLERKIRFYSLS